MTIKDCPLCNSVNERVVVRTDKFRVIRVEDKAFPGYYRLIWNDHVKEMSDLDPADRHLIWEALSGIEEIMLRELRPTKINLAQFGTMVPHLHWHLIARYEDDATFPDSYWSAPKRETSAAVLQERTKRSEECDKKIKEQITLDFGISP